MSKLLILGAGGHGKVVADIATIVMKWEYISFLDDREDYKEVIGYPIIGKLKEYKLFKNEFQDAFVAIGNNEMRLNLIEELNKEGFTIPTIIHSDSTVSKFCNIGYGTVIMPGTVVNAGVKIGKGCIINTSSSVDHDCILGDGVHISPAAHIGGTVNVGNCAWISVGCSIANNVSIGCNSIVAAGAAVLKDVPDNAMVAGIPAIIKKVGINKK